MDIEILLNLAVEKRASDIFISAGVPPTLKINGVLTRLDADILTPKDTEKMVQDLFSDERLLDHYCSDGEADFSISRPGIGRFRVSAYTQRGSAAAVLRVIRFDTIDEIKLNIPEEVLRFYKTNKGLVLVTGATGSGKSTTLSALIHLINKNYNYHILTLEDPIEFLHRHEKSLVNQREVGLDTKNYETGLRSALRESPDVIFIGEMRDYETMQIALTAAETGHLVMSTLHTTSASMTIDRIIDVFPPQQQQQVRIQLASCIQAVFSQQLVPTLDGSLIPVFEVMVATTGIRNMIRDGKVHQIDAAIQTGAEMGMMSMDSSLSKLYLEGLISMDTAEEFARDVSMLKKSIEISRKKQNLI